MKKMSLAVLIFLLMAALTLSVPKVSATTTTEEDLRVTYTEEDCNNPIPENSTTEDYLNTTNPYSDITSLEGAFGEIEEPEGSHPLYVLVFGDEEERDIFRSRPLIPFIPWTEWALLQLERGDEALVANFGIDIRILGFLEWDSDDSKNSMYDLWEELESDTEQYLRQWYNGEYWSNYVDAIIGITCQETTADDPPIDGLSSSPLDLDQGRIFTLLKWQVYWKDDNLVQHEVSHLYYADDHDPVCCVMACHLELLTWLWEDQLWWVFAYVPCAYTSYDWCTVIYSCYQIIQQNSGRYPLRTLTISATSGGTTDPAPETYIHGNGESVDVTADEDSGYIFQYWILDGTTAFDNPITVTMGSDHTLTAYFIEDSGGCPYVYTWNGTEFLIDNNLLGVSGASGGADVEDYYRLEQPLVPRYEGTWFSWYSLQISEFENEHSYLDKVRLYAVDHDADVNIALTPEGQIRTYSNPNPPVSAEDNYGSDWLPYLLEADDVYYRGFPEDYITLDFGNLDVSQAAKLVLRANVDFKKEPWMCIHVQVLNETDGWTDTVVLRTRNLWSTTIVDLTGYLPNPDGTLQIRLYFTGIHKIDYIGLDTTPQADYELHCTTLASANHSVEGNVRWKLLFSDNIYVELIPNQQIELKFILPNNLEEARTFIIYVEGHYETIS